MAKAFTAVALAGIFGALVWAPSVWGNPPEELSPATRAAIEALEKNGANINSFQSANGGHAFQVNCYATKATEENLRNLELIPNVERLWLGASFNMSPEAWQSISQLSELQHLYLYSGISDEDVAYLVEFSELRSLSLQAKNLTSSGLWHLEELIHLETLNLQQVADADEHLFGYLAGLPSLRGLNLSLVGNQSTELKGLGKLSELTSLSISGPRIQGDVMSEIGQLQNLRSLTINSIQATEEDLEALGKLKQLTALNIYGSQFATEGLVHLKNLDQLNTARLSNSNIGDEGLRVLAKLPKLQYLDLNQTEITDKGLEDLEVSPSLSSLQLRGTKVTSEGIAKLNERVPKLRIVTSLGNP